jgi:hypothetical protein
MSNQLENLSETIRWRLLVDAAKKAVQAQGYSLQRVPGRGLSNIWTLTKNGQTKTASIRTTRDRWIAFPPLEGGKKWKTLDDVDTVVVAAVDSKDEPENIEVMMFSAEEVRKRFDAAYAARIKDGQTVKDNFGMWVGLDHDDRGLAASVGSGIAEKHERLATYSIAGLLEETPGPLPEDGDVDNASGTPELSTIAEVMAWTRSRLATIAGVEVEAIKLDLKIEY